MQRLMYNIYLKSHNWKQKNKKEIPCNIFLPHCCTEQELSPMKHFPTQNSAKIRRKHEQNKKAIAHDSNLNIIINK